MTVLAVDLAARYSAACRLDLTDGTVLQQWDSWGRTEDDFILSLVQPWMDSPGQAPAAMVVEDLPHRLPFAALVKRVCRLQGRILDRMGDQIGEVVFLPPAVWRRAYAGLKRGTGPDAVVPAAAELGYQAPGLAHRCLRAGDKAIARKVATDYCAAYLIGTWAVATWQNTHTFDAAGTSRYTDPTMRSAT